jgi:antitoxin component of MazEF toxin-antitoxin module
VSQHKIKRWSRTITNNGHSLQVTIPADLAKQWQVYQGHQAVAYELDGALLVIPLDRLLQWGEPKLLKQLATLLEQPDP